jgi:ElaB/YqjD/DUF883 family membrane-anchored ribosome-binding protein
MPTNQKRAELKSKVDAAQKRNQDRQEQRTIGDYAREARDDATSFVKEHPITTLAGGIALGVLVAALVPGPGRRLRKQATRRGAVLAGVLADLAVNYGSQALDGAGKAARSGQSRLGDLGETLSEALSDGARSLRREAGEASDSAGSLTRSAGKRASKTLRDLRSRMSN